MDLLPTPEQDEIVGSIRAVLADRHVLGQPMTDELWATAAEQGWFGLGIAEADGGVGYSLVEESLLCIELGRACVPGPFLGTIIAAAADDPDLRHQVMAGERPVGIAERENDHLRVLDGRSGGLAVVLDEMAVVELGSLESQPSFDQLVEVAVAPDWTPLTSAGNRDRAALLIAGALAGLAAATMAQSVSYGMDREQFGQPVGGFQAVKHRCADMAVRSEAALTQVHYAALSQASGLTDARFQTEAAAVVAARAAIDNAEINVQNHGGIGFTLEHTAHRYVTRARVWSVLGGGLRSHLAEVLAAPI